MVLTEGQREERGRDVRVWTWIDGALGELDDAWRSCQAGEGSGRHRGRHRGPRRSR